MIHIHLTQEDIQEAREFNNKLKALKTGLNSRIVGTKDHEIIGLLGQKAFKKYLDHLKVHYEELNEKFGRHLGDSCDFIIGGKKVDVKSSKKYSTICLNRAQYWKSFYKKVNYLVGVHFSNFPSTAIIIGYGYWNDLVRDPEKDFEYNGKQFEMYSLPRNKTYIFPINDIVII